MFKKLFLVLFFVIMGVSIVYSCSSIPVGVSINSGAFDMGNFNVGETLYANSNIEENPLTINLFFENPQSGCYDDENSITMKLLSTSNPREPQQISETHDDVLGLYLTNVVFTYSNPLILPNNFVITYDVLGSSNQLSFIGDDTPPSFTSFSFSPTNRYLRSGDEISLDFTVVDSESGLSSVSISGGDTVNFEDRTTSYTGNYKRNLSSDTLISVTAIDKLGNMVSRNVSFRVDSSNPTLSEFDYEQFYDGKRKSSFKVKIESDSFAILNSGPTISGDFSSINPSLNSVNGICNRHSSNSYICSWEDLEITALEETTSVSIIVNAIDAIGNEVEQTFNVEIMIDMQPPEVLQFYVENSLGIKNIISSADHSTLLYLKVRDDSEISRLNLAIPGMQLLNYDTTLSSSDNDTHIYVWKLGSRVNVYSGYTSGNVSFEVRVEDIYGNRKNHKLNVQVINDAPVIENIEFFETEDIKDGLVNSGEIIDFTVLVSGNNLDYSGRYFVYGDFVGLTSDTSMNNVSGVCSPINTSFVECRFRNIQVGNGYMNRSVKFMASNIAGHRVYEDYYVEVFAVADETMSSFIIEDIPIVAPINRNVIKSSSPTAWFEGSIEKLLPDDDIIIINYQLLGCNESSLNPLLLAGNPGYSLFPDDVIINEGQENINDFAFRLSLRAYSNVYSDDLNDKRLQCTMTLLKRDSTTIYPPEEVNFNVVISFYDLPEGSLLRMHAGKILDLIDDTEGTLAKFEDVYKIYKQFESVCSIFQSGNALVQTFGLAADSIAKALYPTTVGAGLAVKIDKFAKKLQGGFSGLTNSDSISGVTSFITTTCNWVTCRQGGELFGLMSFGGGNSDIGGLYSMMAEAHDFICENTVEIFLDFVEGDGD